MYLHSVYVGLFTFFATHLSVIKLQVYISFNAICTLVKAMILGWLPFESNYSAFWELLPSLSYYLCLMPLPSPMPYLPVMAMAVLKNHFLNGTNTWLHVLLLSRGLVGVLCQIYLLQYFPTLHLHSTHACCTCHMLLLTNHCYMYYCEPMHETAL